VRTSAERVARRAGTPLFQCEGSDSHVSVRNYDQKPGDLETGLMSWPVVLAAVRK
jgi:hypothetical protein